MSNHIEENHDDFLVVSDGFIEENYDDFLVVSDGLASFLR